MLTDSTKSGTTTKDWVEAEVFFDIGSVQSWVHESFARASNLKTWPTAQPVTVRGIGEGGTRILEDAELLIRWTLGNGTKALTSTVVGVMPGKRKIPGDVLLGRDVSKRLRLAYTQSGNLALMALGDEVGMLGSERCKIFPASPPGIGGRNRPEVLSLRRSETTVCGKTFNHGSWSSRPNVCREQRAKWGNRG